MLLLLSSVNKT